MPISQRNAGPLMGQGRRSMFERNQMVLNILRSGVNAITTWSYTVNA